VRSPANSGATVGLAPARSVLIAGVGNIFLRDDGFGVEVARRLALESLPEWVRVIDFGIRGVHLAYEMLDGGYATTILVDATPRGEKPGTVYLIEPDLKGFDSRQPVSFDAHGMEPQLVFSTLQSLGGVPGRVLIVGCEPLECDEGIGLSEPVQRSVDEAVRLVHSVVEDLAGADPRLQAK
jgi:hydrogenase maturation protease